MTKSEIDAFNKNSSKSSEGMCKVEVDDDAGRLSSLLAQEDMNVKVIARKHNSQYLKPMQSNIKVNNLFNLIKT